LESEPSEHGKVLSISININKARTPSTLPSNDLIEVNE
jgi:hypothetical protein